MAVAETVDALLLDYQAQVKLAEIYLADGAPRSAAGALRAAAQAADKLAGLGIAGQIALADRGAK